MLAGDAIPKIIGNFPPSHDVNKIFTDYLHESDMDLSAIASAHGRDAHSTALEFGDKVMKALGDRFAPELTIEHLEEYFSLLTIRKSVKDSALSKMMETNPTLQEEILWLTNAFGLVGGSPMAREMKQSIDQGRVIANLNEYLRWNNLPVHLDEQGICNGLASVFAKYALKGRQDIFFEMLRYIAGEKPSKEMEPELNHFVVKLLI